MNFPSQIILAVASLLCCLTIASGAEPDNTEANGSPASNTSKDSSSEESLWEMNLAAFGRYGPAYPASKENQVNIVPLPYPKYRGRILRLGDDTDKPVRTRIFRRDNIKVDIDFGLNFPVDSDDIDARTGMPDLDLLAEAGPELGFEFLQGPKKGGVFWALQLRGATSFDSFSPTWRGLVFSSELKYVRPFKNSPAEIKFRIIPEWATSDYMDFFYGVAPEYANPGRDTFRASSGYLGTKTAFTYKRQLNKKLEFITGISLGLYQGAKNRNSPLYTSETTTGVFLALMWKFWESKRKAEPIDLFKSQTLTTTPAIAAIGSYQQ
jgi:outer membrane protein